MDNKFKVGSTVKLNVGTEVIELTITKDKGSSFEAISVKYGCIEVSKTDPKLEV